MTNQDFLSSVDNDNCKMFTTPIADNETIYNHLNVSNEMFVYGLCVNTSVILPISRETLSEMLSRNETHKYYDVVYLCEEEINLKNDEQPVFQKSDNSGFYCSREHIGENIAKCDNQCDNCTGTNMENDSTLQQIDEFEEEHEAGATPVNTIIPNPTSTDTTETVWDLDYHESLIVEGKWKNYLATRVPGGWLYKPHGKGLSAVPSTFVPFEAQKFDTGCVLCGNSIDKNAKLIVEVLDYLNDMGESIDVDTSGVLLNNIKEYLKKR